MRVIEIPEPSKAEAVRVGNAACSTFPRVHLDADVVLSGASLRGAGRARWRRGGPWRPRPGGSCPRTGAACLVRAYYDVWERLPQVRAGLFGRGAFALSEEGQARVSDSPR